MEKNSPRLPAAQLISDESKQPSAVKTEAKPDQNTMVIKVQSQEGNELHFKIKPTTLFSKVVDQYCKCTGTERDAVRFLFDGNRIDPQKTAAEIGLHDGDEVDVMIQQFGGDYFSL